VNLEKIKEGIYHMEGKIRQMNIEEKLKDIKLADLKQTALDIEQKLKVDLSVCGNKISEIGKNGMMSARDCGELNSVLDCGELKLGEKINLSM
jgi:hypothetical protein